jgi:hypothetical protein
MEESEIAIEKIQEDIEHHAKHGGKHASWLTWSALLSAFLAVFAAVAALNSGRHANEAMMDQIKSSDKWAFFQAKGIKSSILETRLAITQLNSQPNPEQIQKINNKLEEYAKEQTELKAEAEERELESHAHFHAHEVFARAVTFFQIAIAVTAIAVLAGRRRFLFVALAFGLLGSFFLAQGLLL